MPITGATDTGREGLLTSTQRNLDEANGLRTRFDSMIIPCSTDAGMNVSPLLFENDGLGGVEGGIVGVA